MRTRRVSITGVTGQLGSALIATFGSRWEIDGLSRPEVDLRDWKAVRGRIASHRPHLVIHAGAATDVDGCERDPEMAFAINALGTRHVAGAAAAVGADLVYVSTNYVFDGGKEGPYHEFDGVNPINVYGSSKLAGEREALDAVSRCHIVRTAWLYSTHGRNFVTTMQKLMTEREKLTVVSDQFGNPTFAFDLAAAIGELIARAPFGIHHVVNSGAASWYDWALEIAAFDGAATSIDPIPGSAWPRPATPPANGTMSSLSLPALGIDMPDWREALRRRLST